MIAKRANRFLSQRARAVCAVTVNKQQQELQQQGRPIIITPPCTWCGLPTGCFCDGCSKPVCSECYSDFSVCIDCFRTAKGCTEGEARQHAAIVGRRAAQSREETTPRRAEDVSLEEISNFMSGVVPELVPLERKPRPAAPSKEGPSDEDLRQRHAAAAVLEEQRQRRAEAKAKEERVAAAKTDAAVLEEEQRQRQIQEENRAAHDLRRERRRGACTSAPFNIEEDEPPARPTDPHASNHQSRRRARKQQRKAELLAAAKHKSMAAEKDATQRFLRETAEAFAPRAAPDYDISPTNASTQAKPKANRQQHVEPDDVLLGLWEAKLKHPGITNI